MRIKNEPIITATDLTIAYGPRVIVSHIDFTVNRGDIFVIMGGSGSGKSTILKTLIGLKAPESGTVMIGKTDLWGADASTRERILQSFGISFQSGALFSSMTVGENVAMPMDLTHKMSPAQIARRVDEKLDLVGLRDARDLYPTEISGGMIKRAALARALALNPEIVFFDEPSAGLDPIRSKQLDDLIVRINRDGTTIVMVTHELDSIMSIATNSVYIDAQTHGITGRGNPRELLKTTKNHEIIQFLTRGNTKGKTC